LIYVRLAGGLGNQLFQYAAGRGLAALRGTGVVIDRSFYRARASGATPRTLEIHNFMHCGRPPSLRESIWLGLAARARVARRLRPVMPFAIREEARFGYDPTLLEAPDNTLLVGYWQSERYFAHVADVLREELAFASELPPSLGCLRERIEHAESVSLHVRRGDYVADDKARMLHGCCDIDYYRRAVERIATSVKDPVFFVFSDDPEWSRQTLRLSFETVHVTHTRGMSAAADLQLMSLCRHNILANSTFSWWGAWLNRNPGRLVVAPARWFARDDIDTRDLLPAEWARI
jgi:hypothetical protein